ncbi:MAG TPA: MMPL family transporter [Actinomycetota bacterium]|nr:MMPL family transporter [Actinomycetota bacterium]
MRRLGHFVVRHPRRILIVSVLLIALAGAVGASVVDHLSTGGFEDPASESTRAAARIEEVFGIADPDLVLLVSSKTGSVDDPEVAVAGLKLTRSLANEAGVGRVESYWSLGGAPPLRSLDGSKAMVLAHLEGSQNEKNDTLEVVTPKYERSDGVITVAAGGFAEVFRQVTSQVEKDLVRSEMVAIPILLVLLLFVFRSAVAAALPLGVGVVAVLGTLLILRAVAAITEVSIFALNLTTGMGLGLGIDYSLFIVSRFREELAGGKSVHDSVVRTVETAGRTVVFSAVAVAASLSALLLFPIVFLRSFAYAGIPVVALASVGATVTLPALLAILGPRIDSLSVRRPKEVTAERATWHRIAMFVMRRPIPIATAGIAVLLLLGTPFLGVRLGLPDDRVLPPGAPGRVVSDQLRANFAGNEAFALSVLADGVDVDESKDDVEAFAVRLSEMDEVARVDAATGSYVAGQLLFKSRVLSRRFTAEDATFFSVVLDPSIEPQSTRAEQLVHRIRDLNGPFPVQVTGASADLVDSKQVAFERFPLALLWIGLVTLVSLFLLFGSIIIPVKALLLNLLSLTATFGAMVWVFQQGHFAEALDFTATGSLTLANIILMFCIAFGLSMDYEVFLLSRIKEEHDRTGENEASVALGLEKTGRIVTAAAALIAIVFIAMISSGVSFIKMFGMGLALAVIMDATLVRAALVPAFMKLMGSLNWWAPAPLRRVHERFGIREAPVGGVES